MPDAIVKWFAHQHLGADLAALMARLTAWADRIYWDGYAPLAKVCLVVAALAALIILALAYTDEREGEVWTTLAIAGRWMGGVVVIVALAAAWVSGRGMV